MPELSFLLPSVRLPSIRQVCEHQLDVLGALVEYLRAIYNPPIRGARRIKPKARTLKDVARVRTQGVEDASEQLREDEFERAYAVRWLTGLVAQGTLLANNLGDDNDALDTLETLLRSAAVLIPICAGTAAARALSRQYTFPSPTLSKDVEVQLTDVPISADEDLPTVGTQTWGSACLLAEMLVEDSGRFGLSEGVLSGAKEVRVLELGAGTGLVSLALAKLLSARFTATAETHAQRGVTVVASDYHPAVLKNLQYNIEANFPDGMLSHVSLNTRSLDWSEYSSPCGVTSNEGETGAEYFDLILGADIVYEPTHAVWVHDCVSALLRKSSALSEPTAAMRPRFHLVMPLRPTHTYESRAVDEAFPPFLPQYRSLNSRGHVSSRLCVLEKETIVCEAEDPGSRREVEYVHYEIGWG